MLQTRHEQREQDRETSLRSLMPQRGELALDVGARDCYYAHLMAEKFDHVIALDLQQPQSDQAKVETVAGDATALQFEDRRFNFVLCAEVLEHIPPELLPQATKELARVTGGDLLIGVPCEQDLRIGRTTCANCGHINPPWGHVNSFDIPRLRELFRDLELVKTEFVGQDLQVTNGASVWLLERAGNPYGTYEQDEACIACDQAIGTARRRSMSDRALSKIAYSIIGAQRCVSKPKARWIHALFRRA